MINSYVVLETDTLDSIASKFGTSPYIIKQLNGSKPLIPGNTIMIPNFNNNIFDYYVVKKDDYIYPNQILLVPKAGTILYITANGDTILGIANGMNVDVMELINQNKNIYLQPEQLIAYKYNN